jgi:vacuolar-type H+-ATPase subunit I/STV1
MYETKIKFMIRAFIYCTMIILLSACSGGSNERKDGYSETAKNPEDSLFQDVMDGHDQAMAKIGKIEGYRKMVDQKLDSLKKVKSSAKSEVKKAYEKLRADLKEAEDHMNTWMHEFSIDSAQDNIERRLKYLDSEKSKVHKIREEIFSALTKADSLLKK